MSSIEEIETAALRRAIQVLYEEHKKQHDPTVGTVKGLSSCKICFITKDALNSNSGIRFNMLLVNSNKPELTKELSGVIVDLQKEHAKLLKFECELERLSCLEDYIQVARNIFGKISAPGDGFNPDELDNDIRNWIKRLWEEFGLYDAGNTKLPNKKPGGV